MQKEIERKFIVDKLPGMENMKVLGTQQVYQTYLAIGDEQVRVRMSIDINGTDYTLTIKRGHGIIRDELEIPISRDTYLQLTKYKSQLIKTRYNIHLGNSTKAYIDEYSHEELIIAEIEFDHILGVNQLELPEWFGKEVTGVKEYENQYLWEEAQTH